MNIFKFNKGIKTAEQQQSTGLTFPTTEAEKTTTTAALVNSTARVYRTSFPNNIVGYDARGNPIYFPKFAGGKFKDYTDKPLSAHIAAVTKLRETVGYQMMDEDMTHISSYPHVSMDTEIISMLNQMFEGGYTRKKAGEIIMEAMKEYAKKYGITPQKNPPSSLAASLPLKKESADTSLPKISITIPKTGAVVTGTVEQLKTWGFI